MCACVCLSAIECAALAMILVEGGCLSVCIVS